MSKLTSVDNAREERYIMDRRTKMDLEFAEHALNDLADISCYMGDKAPLMSMLKVLSSHLEDIRFRLKRQGGDA